MKLKKEGAPMSKYEEVLKKYDCDLDDQKVAEAVKKIIEEKVPENDTLEVKKFLLLLMQLLLKLLLLILIILKIQGILIKKTLEVLIN